MPKRRKVDATNSVDSTTTATTTAMQIDDDEEDDYPAFTSLEDVEQARTQLTARFQQGEEELESKCNDLQKKAEELEAKLRAKLKAHMFRLAPAVKAMKMSAFMRQYDCTQLKVLLGSVSAVGDGSGSSSSSSSSSAAAKDAPLGRYGTIKTPWKKKTSASSSSAPEMVPQTPMNSGTGATAAQAGMFSVMKGPDGGVTVVLPDGHQVKSGDTLENKEATFQKLKAMQDDLQSLMDTLK